jgi:hypothetical protein
LLALLFGAVAAAAETMPRYDHILVIVAENRGYADIIGSASAPRLTRLAASYGSATQFFAEVHPSEGNYVAMLGGDTFGIHDDDAWYCKPGSNDPNCPLARRLRPYADHTVVQRSLMDQLADSHLSWKGYFESIPAPGSKAIYFPDAQSPVAGLPSFLYASKHNGFINFKTVQDDPALAGKLVGFDVLLDDLVAGRLPHYAHIVPNQCNDMHGLDGADVPADCSYRNAAGVIARGDAMIGDLVEKIQASPVWSGRGNVAIVITWDEDGGEAGGPARGPQGCCGFDPKSIANFGGGHIPTLVVTNHGPRRVQDGTPYNHYSLLRTAEEAFGIGEYLFHAGDAGVHAMTPLFLVR